MSTEGSRDQRRHKRLKKPFDATWRGASGSSPCRVLDLSLSGCFIHAIAMPMTNEKTVVTIKLAGDHSLELVGRVVYTEPAMGFAVEFEPAITEQSGELRDLVTALLESHS